LTDSDSLLAQGENAIAAVAAYIERSEERAAYREEHNRTLSKAHAAQLADLRQRIDMIIDPPADTATLRREFEELQRRLEGIE
jgi:hypothetical protein